MIKRIFITLVVILFYTAQVQAKIDIVYPTKKDVTINAETTFFSGNTDNNATVTINSKPVKLWENNFFVHVVPLEYGKNKIKITSTKNGKTEEVTYTVKRNKLATKWIHKKKPDYDKNEEGVLCARTIKENSTVRSGPSTAFKRIYDFQQDIILYLDGKQGEYYKIKENGNEEYWIHESNISEPITVPEKLLTKMNGTKQYSDENYDYQIFYLTNPVLYTIERTGNLLKLVIYGVKGKENNFEYCFEFDGELLAYECYYEGNNLIFKKAKLKNEINPNMPLKNINIFIDAGHGGKEKGTVGPSRVNEKDVNLDIALKLIKLLEAAGANVTYSRNCDVHVELYDRVKMAKNNNALISLSIHNNSLPYGKDPYIQHGTETHYFNENAKMLAEIINNNLSNDLNLKNNGVKKSSFALNRSTNPISVLIEVAYMINPEEYILLKNEKFRDNVAKSIKKSLDEYIIYLTNKKNMI